MSEPEPLPADWSQALSLLVGICASGGAVSTGAFAARLTGAGVTRQPARTVLRGLRRRGYARAFATNPHGQLHWAPTIAGRLYVERQAPP